MTSAEKALVALAAAVVILMSFIAVAGAITGRLDTTVAFSALIPPLTAIIAGVVMGNKNGNGKSGDRQ